MANNMNNFIEYILIHYRWVFVCFFLLPMSFLYDIWFYLRNLVTFKINSAPKQHHDKVRNVQKQVREWGKTDKKKLMCTARPGWQTVCFRRPRYKNTSFNVKVNLVDILEIDVAKQVVRVEPLVTMGQLTATLIPLGWTIPVLPELDDLTIGGLVMGTGIESASHNDSSLVRCTEDENSDLFYSVPWSYGTLGFLTAVELKLIPAKKYIKLNYYPTNGLKNISNEFTKSSEDLTNDFVEGLVFNKNEGVIMTGNFVDTAEIDKINEIGKWYKPWFFKHVESMLNQKAIITEYIPLRHYYHRHTRSLFWELQDIIPFGNNYIFRMFLGWMMPPKISLLKLTQTQAVKKLYENHHVFQDMLIPIDNLEESVNLFHDVVDVYPLWLCPFLLPRHPGMVHPTVDSSKLYVDIGVYGVPKASNFIPKESTRRIEQHTAEVCGFQMLYADTYTTKDEFRKMFDHTLYDKVRQELNCASAFPEVYDKVSKAARI